MASNANGRRGSAAVALRDLLGLAIVATACACLPTPQHIRETTPVAVDATVGTLDTSLERARLGEILASVDVKTAAREFAEGVLDASRAELSSPQAQAQLREAVQRLVVAVVRAAEQAFGDELGPAARSAVSRGIDEAVAAMTSADASRRLSALSAAISDSAVAALVDRLPAAFAPPMREALRQTVADSLAPALSSGLEQVTPAAGAVARVTSREAMLGVGDALRGDLGTAIKQVLNESRSAARDWLLVAATVIVGLLAVLGGAGYALRRAVLGRDDRERTIALLTSAIQHAAEQGRGPRGVLDRITAQANSPGKAYLDRFLAANPHLCAHLSEQARGEDGPAHGGHH